VASLAAGARAALAVTAECGLSEGGTAEVAGNLGVHGCDGRISRRRYARQRVDTFEICELDRCVVAVDEVCQYVSSGSARRR
jgi:hypothetical protein